MHEPTVALQVLQLIIGAPGGACIILAPDEELQKLAPHAHVSDGGSMTQRLKHVHVSTAEFADLFFEFAAHSSTDRWPMDHKDMLLRGRPKDGVGVLLSPSGFRVKCAVRLEGLPHATRAWSCMGMRHNAALAASEVMSNALVFVRSESGMVHLLVRVGSRLAAYSVCEKAESDAPADHEGAGVAFPDHHDAGALSDGEEHKPREEDLDDVEEEAGKLVQRRQELEENLARLKLETGDEPTLPVARALHDLGVLCREGGDISTARQHIEDSLRMRRSLLGSDPCQEVASSLHELGLVFKDMRHLRMAQRCLQQSLEMKQTLAGGEARAGDVAATLQELGAVCVERRRLQTAKRHLEDVLAAEPAESPERARALRELGMFEMKGGNFHSAWVRLQQALTIQRSLHGSTPHPDVARTHYSLGLVALRSGDLVAARQHLEESLDICHAIHGDTPHQDVQKVLRLLAALNVRDGNLASWRDLCRKSIDMHKAIHRTNRMSAIPAKLDMLGLFLIERALTVKAQCVSIDAIVASASSSLRRHVLRGS